MSLLKKISFLVFIISMIIGAANIVSAQTGPAFSDTKSQPEVYIKDLVLDKTAYQAGDTIKGSFTLLNIKDQAVSDVYSEVTLAGDYQPNTLALVFYDSQKSGPYYLQGNEARKINFTYVLPKAVAGDNLGIQVSALLGTGFRMGWSDFHIKVAGKMGIVNITKAFISIGDSKFGLGVGPAVNENEKAFLEITLVNPTKSTVEINPMVKIYNQAIPSVVKNLTVGSSKILPNGSVNIKYELPKFDNKAGIYVGDIQFPDASGVERAVEFGFRYVIAGDVAVIKGLTLDRTIVERGDNINVTLDYSGTPFNVRNSSVKVEAVYDLDVKLFSETGKLIAEYNKPMDFNQGTQTVLALKASDTASDLRAEVTVKKGGAVLAEYQSSLPAIQGQKNTETESSNLVWWIILAIVILAIVGSYYLKGKVKTKK